MTDVLTSRRDASREVLLLSAQLDVLGEIVAGVPLPEALAGLIHVVEAVSPSGVIGSVLLLDDDGLHLRHGAAPSLAADYNEAIDGIAIGPSVGSCGTAAYRRERVIVTDVQTDALWSEFRDLAAAAGVRACWSTPIIGAAGDLLGTFAMYYPQPQKPNGDDLALIDVLVRTVAMAIERSRADEERENALRAERVTALTLQHSLLPEVPPRLGSVDLDARYRTGDPGVEVGGDWYDAIDVPEGVVIVAGDVQGHDLGAAALMGQLRTVVRAYAAEGHPPASIVARANAYLARLDTERLATAVVVHLDQEARVATVASAGHLPPMLLAPDADGTWSARDLSVAVGPPLGVGVDWAERSTMLPGGAVLLLYTDGVVETRAWPIDHGLALLRAALDRLPGPPALGAVLDAALGLVPAGLRGDDVAALAAALPAQTDSTDRRSRRWLPPQPMSPPLARSWVEGLLEGWAVDRELVERTRLVVTELVTNAVRNTDDPVRIVIAVDDPGGEVVVEVFDRSHRLPYLHQGEVDDTAGRGLRIVADLAADWGVREEADGKTVWARLRHPAAG